MDQFRLKKSPNQRFGQIRTFGVGRRMNIMFTDHLTLKYTFDSQNHKS